MGEQQQQQNCIQDTRTHVVGELYDTERSYVESLQILVEKYMKPLKSYDSNKSLVDSSLVDEIFYTIPEILEHHENFLSALQDRISSDWDSSQVIGNVFIEAIIDTYTAFINNWKNARHAIKLASQAKPAFERFLEAMSREHKNKLTLDALLIMPVQRIPRYELLIKELIKHTPEGHPDHGPLIEAQKQIHELALKIDRAEKEMLKQEQLRDIEALIEGHIDLQHPQRDFIRYDLITISASTTLTIAKKERVLFLFCDLLVMTSIKKKVSRRSNLQAAFTSSSNDLSLLEGNKFKLLLKVPLDQIDVKHDYKAQQVYDTQTAQIQHNLSRQHRQQINDILSDKRRELENDLMLLQQIESLSSRLNLAERSELDMTICNLSQRAQQNLLSLNNQKQNIDETESNQDLYVIQQQKFGALDQHQISPASVSQALESSELSERQSSSGADQNTTLEFMIINFNASKDERSLTNTNLSSSSMASDHSNEQSNLSGSASVQQHYSSSGQNIDGGSNGAVNQMHSSSYESLVVTFISAERRQTFLQAFIEAKQIRIHQQRSQNHLKMFSSSLTLRLSQENQSPVKSLHRVQHPMAGGLGAYVSSGSDDLRRMRLQHQDEVDLRNLESLTAAIRNNRAANIAGSAATTARNSSAPYHTSPYSNTIVHQMSAPLALAGDNYLHTDGFVGDTSAAASIQHCDTCSSSCILGAASRSQDKQSDGSLAGGVQATSISSNSSQQHQNHHHHQLMHQPASQPAMLNMVCCHENHHDNKPALISYAQAGVLNAEAGKSSMGILFDDSRNMQIVASLPMAENSNFKHQQQGFPGQAPFVSLKFAPKFMLTIPMNFLTTQHPALQFTCSATRKRLTQTVEPMARHEVPLNGSDKSQTVQDDLGQFWLCMSNGYVSHVALISFRKRKVSTGSHGGGVVSRSSTVADKDDQFGPATKSGRPMQGFQCYDVIPMIQSGGDICKSQINCATHVGWSEAASKAARSGSPFIHDPRETTTATTTTTTTTTRTATTSTATIDRRLFANDNESGQCSMESQVTVAVKSASPPIYCKRQGDGAHSMRSTGLSESAPSTGLLEDERLVEQNIFKLGAPSASFNQLSSFGPSSRGDGGGGSDQRFAEAPERHPAISSAVDTGASCQRFTDDLFICRPRISGGQHYGAHPMRSFRKRSSEATNDLQQLSSIKQRHHHSHGHLRRAPHGDTAQGHHQRSLSPSCSRNYNFKCPMANDNERLTTLTNDPSSSQVQCSQNEDTTSKAVQDNPLSSPQAQQRGSSTGAAHGNLAPHGANGAHHNQQQHSQPFQHHHHHHKHHHNHSHHHHHHRLHQAHHGHHNHHHHHHHHRPLGSHHHYVALQQTNNISGHSYSGRHHTVPLAELRRALERQKRIASEAESIATGAGGGGGGSGSALDGVGRYALPRQQLQRPRHQLTAPPPNNTPSSCDRSPRNSSDGGSGEHHHGSPADSSLDLKPADGCGDAREGPKVHRSSTPPASYTGGGGGGQKSSRSARMLRHQASLKTSSILAKLVGGASRGSSYLKRKSSPSCKGKTKNSSLDKQSDLDDNDTDTDNSGRKQEENSSNESAVGTLATCMKPGGGGGGGGGGLAVPVHLRTGRLSSKRAHNQQQALDDSNMSNAAVVSPLSSASSLNSTNSSLTVNSACASLHSCGSCYLQLFGADLQPHWSSDSCCAFDTDAEYGRSRQCSTVLRNTESSNATASDKEQNNSCTMRARSATVPCRAFCHQSSFDHPDSYLITKCSNNPGSDDLSRIRDNLLEQRVLGRTINDSYRVSEIVKESRDASEPREIYHKGSTTRMSGDECAAISKCDNSNSQAQTGAQPRESELFNEQSSLWLGCEDGSLIVIDCLASAEQHSVSSESNGNAADFNQCRNIHSEIKFDSPLCDMKNFKDQIVFVALANGQLAVFTRGTEQQQKRYCDQHWALKKPKLITLCKSEPNAKSTLCLADDREQLWYAYGRCIYVLNIRTLDLDATIMTPTNDKSIQYSMQSISIEHLERTLSLNGIWVSFKGSALIQCYDCSSYNLILEMSLLEPINKVLSYGNEIIRQHKTACLGATSLLSVSTSELGMEIANEESTSLFIGTTAGIIIYITICHAQLRENIKAEKFVWNPQVISLRHGHSGQVKFLRLIEMDTATEKTGDPNNNDVTESSVGKGHEQSNQTNKQLCLLSAGAGIDLYGPNNEQQVIQQLSGDEDCLNHMILWQL